LALAGFHRGTQEEAEWVRSLEGRGFALSRLYALLSAARFAQAFGAADQRDSQDACRSFDLSYKKTVPPARRLLAWVFPPLALVLKPGGGSHPGRRGGLLLLVLLLSLDSPAQDGDQFPGDSFQDSAGETRGDFLGDSPEELLYRGRRSEEAEFYEGAVEAWSRGEELYPLDPRFPRSLGDLYFYRQLYRLAWEEYKRVERIRPGDQDNLYRLSQTAANLNENHIAAAYLEQLLLLEPENRVIISNLGWIYYKIHRLEDGERILLSALDQGESNPGAAMTLAIIYGDLFRYQDARRRYLEAITGFEEIGIQEHVAIAHYNLSILESRFYHYALAMEETKKSLEWADRSSGRLARGEMLLRRLEIGSALGEYQLAYRMDTSPLSKQSLSQGFQIAGRLEEARLYAEDCLERNNESWMANYGTDPVRFRRDLHSILKDTYKGLANREQFLAWTGPLDYGRSLLRRLRYRFQAEVHRILFRKYSLLAGEAYGTFARGEIPLDALTQYYNAFEDYPGRAVDYLRQARAFEEPLIPESRPFYAFEEGTLLQKTDMLYDALARFDPQWERDLTADTLAEISLQMARKGRSRESREAAEDLYALNQGALRQRGIPLPGELRITGASPRTAKALIPLVRKAGLVSTDLPRYRLHLTVDEAAGRVEAELRDNHRDRTMLRRTLPLGATGKDRAAFSRSLSEALFVESGN